MSKDKQKVVNVALILLVILALVFVAGNVLWYLIISY